MKLGLSLSYMQDMKLKALGLMNCDKQTAQDKGD